MKQSPSYLRARIAALQAFYKQAPSKRDEAGSDRLVLRNGYIPESLKEEFDESVELRLHHNKHLYPDKPLTFTELTSFNTWFAMNPDKVAGEEYVTTSLHFPIMLKGSQQRTIETIRGGLGTKENPKALPDTMADVKIVGLRDRANELLKKIKRI